MSATTSQPTIASDDGLLPGVVDIDGPRTRSARRTRWRMAAPAVVRVASAHGPVPSGPPTAANLLFGWTLEPDIAFVLGLMAVVSIQLVRRVNRAHPGNRVPPQRSICFLAALGVIAFALMSG